MIRLVVFGILSFRSCVLCLGVGTRGSQGIVGRKEGGDSRSRFGDDVSRERRSSRPRRAGGGSSRSGLRCGSSRRLKDGDIRTAGRGIGLAVFADVLNCGA